MAPIETIEKKGKRKKTVIDDNKLLDLNENYRIKEHKKAYHRLCDMEEIRSLERLERRRYERVRRQKRVNRMRAGGDANILADSARAKWKGLRDTFRGELRKVNRTIASGTPCTSTNWEYFNEMVFVKDQIYSNKRNYFEALQNLKRNAPARDQSDSCQAESSVDENNSVDIAHLCRQEVVEGDGEVQTQVENDSDASSVPARLAVDTHPAVEDLHTQIQATDDDYNFLMSILPQLRSLPTVKNLYVRLKIQELLFNEIVSMQQTA